MREELDNKLCAKYPEIFQNRYDDMGSTAMNWGFECGDGWYRIIDALCGCMQGYTAANRKHQVVASQVKEKYGTLRFYYTGGDDLTDGMVWLAEAMSAVTCEICGEPGTLNDEGWMRTLCDKHQEARL
jgi:hypothetical protein